MGLLVVHRHFLSHDRPKESHYDDDEIFKGPSSNVKPIGIMFSKRQLIQGKRRCAIPWPISGPKSCPSHASDCQLFTRLQPETIQLTTCLPLELYRVLCERRQGRDDQRPSRTTNPGSSAHNWPTAGSVTERKKKNHTFSLDYVGLARVPVDRLPFRTSFWKKKAIKKYSRLSCCCLLAN